MKIIQGIVIHGEKLGRKIGFPTANISYSDDDISDSVFHTNIVLKSKIYRGVGTYMKSKKIFEVHIFDFDEDIYGEELEVILLKKIRDNRKFESLEEVGEQISIDKDEALSQKLYVLTFGSFDVLHKGHEYYLRQARKHGTHLITIVATDSNIEKIKGRPPQYSLLERVESLLEKNIAHEVIAGSDNDPMKWLHTYSPHCICLGYDQRGKFVDKLPQKIQEIGLDTYIIRIESFHPDMYKSSILKKK